MIDHDSVNSPSHYTAGRIEVIDFIEDQKFEYHLGNAVKYVCRAGKKDPAKFDEDLRKAIWYIERARLIRMQTESAPEKSKALDRLAVGKMAIEDPQEYARRTTVIRKPFEDERP